MTILSKVMSRRVPGGIRMEEGTADTAPARRHMWHSSRCVFAGGEFRTDPVINGCYQSHDRLLTMAGTNTSRQHAQECPRKLSEKCDLSLNHAQIGRGTVIAARESVSILPCGAGPALRRRRPCVG